MRFSAASLLSLLLVSAVSAAPSNAKADVSDPRKCGADTTVYEGVEAVIGKKIQEIETARKLGKVEKRANIAIPVYMHVIRSSTALSGGSVPASQISSQISVLNNNCASFSRLWLRN